MKTKAQHRFYDSHPGLPLDPDSDQYKIVRPIHTDLSHIIIVADGAFFGTLARYGVGVLLPTGKDGWPTAILFINLSGAFLLGLLLEMLQNHGRDEGSRRILRLMFGTGFLGAFTTYSSLVVGTALLVKSDHMATAAVFALVSVIGGICTCAFGIQIATRHHKRRRLGDGKA